MFGTIGQSVGTYQYPGCGLGGADLISMSIKPDRYSLEVWKETLNKINPNISDNLGISPLMYVIWAADDDSMDKARSEKIATIIELFIKNGADCNPQNGAGDTPLLLLCKKKWGDFPQLIEFALEQIINNGTEPDSIMVRGIPLLLDMSTFPGNYSTMAWKILLKKGLNPNVSDAGESPLTNVIKSKSMDDVINQKLATIIELLINNGADCYQEIGSGETPLQLLCSKKWDDFPKLRELAIEQTINKGIDPDSIMAVGKPLLLAMSNYPDYYSSMAWKTLLHKGLDPNVSGDAGMSPLINVIKSKSLDKTSSEKLVTIIELLINNGADCNQESGSGETPLQLLCSKKWDVFPKLREFALEQMRNNGIELDSIMVDVQSLLLAMSRYPELYSLKAWKTLLHKGLDPNVSDDAGMSPLIKVIKSNSSDKVISKKLANIIELLIKNGADCYQKDRVRDNALELLFLKKWDNFPQLRELALEQIRNNGIEPESLKVKGKPLLLAMSKSPIKYSKLALRSVFRYGVLPILEENELEGPTEKKPKLKCYFNDTLEKHKAHFCFRPLEYRCICAVDRHSRGQELTMLPKSIQKDIKHLFYS
ncbi:hypothetical protein [Endozoicomonas sp. ALD040]|uniref:ankyrin repeat domain-containing protein n=1 Tax=unclassified Endozoicomonas TaxID=2644528 RepID=UPI003BB07EF0